MCDVTVFPRVPGLLSGCSPSAVVRGIRAVVVNAVKRVFRGWSLTHVSEEGTKRIEPAGADEDAARAIAQERVVAWLGTSRLHTTPNIVLRCLCFTVCHAFFSPSFRQAFFSKPCVEASARFGITSFHVRGKRDDRISTRTAAQPLSFLFVHAFYECQLPESLSGNNCSVSHEGMITRHA